MNNITKENWRSYKDYISSLWLIDKDSDPLGKKKRKFHGSFVYQVPERLITIYSKKGDWVSDFFAGTKTTQRAAENLGRNSLLFDLNFNKPKTRRVAKNGTIHLCVRADSTRTDRKVIHPAQLTILHPPYHNIIQFSDNKYDLSNYNKLEDFLSAVSRVGQNAAETTSARGHVALVMGDIWGDEMVIPASRVADYLAVGMSMKNRQPLLRAIYIKNIKGNEFNAKQLGLRQYRGLKNGFNIFTHEYIYVWRLS